jgi:acetylornithine/succinyldiaminopimelate/putrescine aminotransferase/dipeptidase
MVVVDADRVLFAKNSDRDPNEAQLLDWQPRRAHPTGARLRATWISVAQVPETHAVLLSRPFWMWGAEMGANEHGVTIGNEAVFTNEPYAELGLTGMDLVRLGLERGATAALAVATITSLLDQYGQGGGCGHENRDFRYHNSFLVADPHEAYVVETAGARWDVEKVTAGARSISNGLTIPGFAERHRDRIRTALSRSRPRRELTEATCRRATGLADLMAVLRDHGTGGASPRYSTLTGAMGAPCMHPSGLVAASQTTASWVAELTPTGTSHWVTATAAPCTALFKPVSVTEPVDLGPDPTDRYDDRSLWWRHEALHRRVLTDPDQLLPCFATERDEVEARWLATPPTPEAAFAEADRLLSSWTELVRAEGTSDRRPLWVRRYWQVRDRWAGRPERDDPTPGATPTRSLHGPTEGRPEDAPIDAGRQPYDVPTTTTRVFAEHVNAGKVAAFDALGLDLIMGDRQGARFENVVDGRWLYNCHSNGGVFNLGHRNPTVVAAVRDALDHLDIGNHHLVSGWRALLAERLAASTGGLLPGVVFGVGGGEANDLAIKVARAHTGRTGVVSAVGGYHGHTGLAMAAGDPEYREPFGPNLAGFTQVPFNDLSALDRAVDDTTAAVILELIPATLGLPLPDPGYLAAVQRLCRSRGVCLIADEVQTGLGRTGTGWYFSQEGLEPDILTTGKGLSGGIFPIAATLMTADIHAFFVDHPFVHISTYGGAEVGCVAAITTLDIIERPGFLDRVNEVGARFEASFADLPFEVRRRGLFMGLKFPGEGDGMLAARDLIRAGVFAVFANNDTSVVQFLPPLTVLDHEIDEISTIVRATFS